MAGPGFGGGQQGGAKPARTRLQQALYWGAVLAAPWGLREGLPPAALSAPLLPPRAVGAGAPQGARA